MENNKKTLWTVGLIALKKNRLLLAYSNNKKAWYLPGGKVDPGEMPQQAIRREIQEELNIDLDPLGLQFHCHISAPAYGEQNNVIMEQDCYLYDLQEAPTPSAEIGDVRYFSLEEYVKEPVQVPGVLIAFAKLAYDKLIENGMAEDYY